MTSAKRITHKKISSSDIELAKYCDAKLMFAVVMLLGIGLVMVASSSVEIADRHTGDPLYYFKRQFIFALMGISAGFVLTKVRLTHWENSGMAILFFMVVLLMLVLVPGLGRTVNGSTRWLALGPFGLQVSEVVKLLLIVYLAGYVVRQGKQIRESFIGFAKPMLVLVVLFTFLLLQPDFGAAMVLLITALGMLYLAGVKFWKFGLLLLASGISMGFVAISSPYRVERFTAFLNPWSDPFGSGFQLTQSLIAIGSGGWSGLGLGASVQKLFYLPEAHTDFVFAVIAEELGLFGVSAVLALFVLLIYRCFVIGKMVENKGMKFGAQIAYGIGIWLGLQVFINIGVNTGVLPTKGLTLPFISAGGSSLLVVCMAIGLITRVYMEGHAKTSRR
ncbi:MAG: putative lipid II flippase FtsW [Gammaproteobacteria bacterium]